MLSNYVNVNNLIKPNFYSILAFIWREWGLNPQLNTIIKICFALVFVLQMKHTFITLVRVNNVYLALSCLAGFSSLAFVYLYAVMAAANPSN